MRMEAAITPPHRSGLQRKDGKHSLVNILHLVFILINMGYVHHTPLNHINYEKNH